MSVNRSGRMNLFSLMQSISEMDDIDKEQVMTAFFQGTCYTGSLQHVLVVIRL